jgi:hypothetical protein
VGAQFYPFYSLAKSRDNDDSSNDWENCALLFGNLSGRGINNFGGTAQYGVPNLSWFFGQNSGGPRSNPCIPHPKGQDER